MRISRLLYTITVILALHSCADNTETPAYTVGETDNAITLSAGVSTNDNGVQTRATSQKYTPFSAQTQLRLRVDGKWTNNNPSGISKTTTAKTSPSASADSDNDNTNDTHTVEFTSAERLYWDDYGTADPGNQAGRAEGLTIYGVAVEGSTSAPEVSDWNSLSWKLPEDQNTNNWKNYDLITSNNIRGTGNTLKFDDVKNNNSPNNLLIFTHAMSKITVNLKADEGFPGYTEIPSNPHFEKDPVVTLLDHYLSGNVDIINGTTSVITTDSKKSSVLKKEGTASSGYTATYCGMMMPGNKYGNSENIIKINADGNIYYVTAKEINIANTASEDIFERGKNYIINVTVKKTEIKVTATVTEWETVNSAEVSPVINITTNFGSNGTGATFENFSFYRSLNLNYGYSEGNSANENNYFANEAIAKKPSSGNQWVFYDGTKDINLYWPNHNTHYQFRGVIPCTSTNTNDTSTSPHVNAVSETDNTQKIDIKNVPFNNSASNNYESLLMIGRPEVSGTCGNTEQGHKQTDLSEGGICATEGTINLNFKYVMSQVEVVLTTSSSDSKDHVNLNENTTLEIEKIYTNGYVKLGDREVITTGDISNQQLTLTSSTDNGQVTLKTVYAIIPQNLTYVAAGVNGPINVRFKITVKNSDNTTDVYYADIPSIKKNDGELITPNSKWESGYHYVYNLKLTKTKINVSATLSDWTTVSSSENVWM